MSWIINLSFLIQRIKVYYSLGRLEHMEEEDYSFMNFLCRIRVYLLEIKDHLELSYNKALPNYLFFGVVENLLEEEVQNSKIKGKLKDIIYYLLRDPFFDGTFKKEQYSSFEEFRSNHSKKLNRNYEIICHQKKSAEFLDLHMEEFDPYTFMRYKYLQPLYIWDQIKLNKLKNHLEEYFFIPEDQIDSSYLECYEEDSLKNHFTEIKNFCETKLSMKLNITLFFYTLNRVLEWDSRTQLQINLQYYRRLWYRLFPYFDND